MPPLAVAAASAAATIGGAYLSGRAQKKAASKSAGVARDTAAQNNALQERIYGQNRDILNPYVQRGNEAGSAINALLGISGTGQAPAAPITQGSGWGGAMTAIDQPPPADYPGFPYAAHMSLAGERDAGGLDMGQMPMQRPAMAMSSPTMQGDATVQGARVAPVTDPNAAYQNAFQNYLNSTGYQFQVDQGNRAITQNRAAAGALNSGATLKALQTYGQNTATGFFKDYLGLLAGQQDTGFRGAAAVAGVGTGYADRTSTNNNNAANAQMGAYQQRADANAGIYGSIAGGISGVANALGSSYGSRAPAQQQPIITNLPSQLPQNWLRR